MIRFKPALPLLALLLLGSNAWSERSRTDILVKERIPYGTPIRTRMLPQQVIDAVQMEFNAQSPKWKTFWQNFVAEDLESAEESRNEYMIIARSVERNCAFALA